MSTTLRVPGLGFQEINSLGRSSSGIIRPIRLEKKDSSRLMYAIAEFMVFSVAPANEVSTVISRRKSSCEDIGKEVSGLGTP
jgi:hypothetical protein